VRGDEEGKVDAENGDDDDGGGGGDDDDDEEDQDYYFRSSSWLSWIRTCLNGVATMYHRLG